MKNSVAAAAFAALAWFATEAHGQSWLRVEAAGARDNQPRGEAFVAAEYGGALPSGGWAGRVRARTLTDASDVTASVSATLERRALSISGAAGAVHSDGSVEPVLSAEMRWSIAHGIEFIAGAETDRYIATLASLDTLLMPVRMHARIDRSGAPRWAFAAAASRESFGDDNPVHTLYAWALLPLTASSRHRLRTGYAIGYQDAAQSRWQADPGRPADATSPNTVPGRYAPYYSPHDVLAHSVLLEGALQVRGAWLSANASYGVYATETAPALHTAAPGGLVFFERTFHPAEVSVAATLPASHTTWLRAELRHQRTAYYRTTGVSVAVTRTLSGS